MSFSIDGTALALSAEGLVGDSFEVASVPKPYTVTWDTTPNPCTTINACLAENPKNILIIDEKVLGLYGKDIVWPEAQIFKVSATETFKGMDGVLSLYDFMHQHHITKGETLVVVGGGITQDLSAFVAATYKRGLDWVFFPTTLLAMSDSCIGGKAGVNYKGSKNQLALFSAPRTVMINPAFLETLASQDMQSGLGEILKLCIIGGLPWVEFFDQVVQSGKVQDATQLKPLIMNALAVKRAVIEMDEFEQHLRKGLNYGHTIGHVIEAMADYAIPHGIAVVLGMLIVNQMSCEQGLLSPEHCLAVNTLCLSLIDEATLTHLKALDTNQLLQRLKQDKKVSGDKITLILLVAPGQLGFVKMPMDGVLEQQLVTIMGTIS
ncbi:MAG: 3-dehydroquinate synthase [Gammaproteobacteria bacterium]|nr:3-dehydroquinate synthase [Gammaproteobacteria bacterium]